MNSPSEIQVCGACGNEIKVMAYRNTGVCCELCRKLRAGEINQSDWIKQSRSLMKR